jgi:glycosyl hydrolase family 2
MFMGHVMRRPSRVDLRMGNQCSSAFRYKSGVSALSIMLVAAFLMRPAHLFAQKNSSPEAKGGTSGLPRLTQKDVLSIKNGTFFLEGEPFAEISFNKFDLFWELYDQLAEGKQLNAANPLVQAQDKALRNLHELGFKTIRIFALPWGPAGPAAYADPEKRKILYAALDKTLDLCDAHGIRVVWSLAAGSFTDTKLDPAKGWVYGEEQQRELIANSESRGRKLLYRYLDETVARYRNRKAVLMWEISNEVTLSADIGDSKKVYNGERMPTPQEVAKFFADVARRIKLVDPLRLVNSGGSNMRESQWHLYQGAGWKTDTFEEQFKCFELLYAHSAVDVIDIHSYPDNKPGYAITSDDGKSMWLDNKGYMSIAKRLGKPLIIGELGLHAIPKTDHNIWDETPNYFESFDDTKAAIPWVEKTLSDVIEAGVPLSYWWCYQSDQPDDRNNRQRFDIDRGRNPELVDCIVEANKRLKAKNRANP